MHWSGRKRCSPRPQADRAVAAETAERVAEVAERVAEVASREAEVAVLAAASDS